LWTGEYFDNKKLQTSYFIPKGNTYYYAKNFKFFIEQATELGRELLLLEEEVTKDYDVYSPSGYSWIDKLLKTSIPRGFRGKFLWLVVTPYLTNVKKLPKKEAVKIANEWLKKSNFHKFLDRDLCSYVENTYKHFLKRGIMPCTLRTLKERHNSLYRVLEEAGVV